MFRYTLDNPLLSFEQRKFYEENGYLVIRNLIEHELLDKLRKRFEDYCEGKLPIGKLIFMKDVALRKFGLSEEEACKRIQHIHLEEVFVDYFCHKQLLDYVSCFTGPRISVVFSSFINKPPDSGLGSTEQPLHQDLAYFPIKERDQLVAAWTAVEPANLRNGCIYVIPGSHHSFPGGKLLPHSSPDSKISNLGYFAVKGCENFVTVPLVMEKGDTVFFHPLLLHGSEPNFSKGCRKAILGHFVTSGYHCIEEKGNMYEVMVNAIVQPGAKGGNKAHSLKEYLQHRTIEVRGSPKCKI